MTGERSSPRPESTRALRSGPAAVPTSACATTRRSSTSSGCVFSAVIQARLTAALRAGLSPFAMGKQSRAARGLSHRGCSPMAESTRTRPNPASTPSRKARCSSVGMLP
ncbi:MAG: hypothetical protein MUE76_09270 [Syntrophales bacterium]|nr:hypothetical protein [Syntrophales bacterium]